MLATAMLHRNVEFVRKPLQVGEGSRRTLDQRLFVRFPRLAAAAFRLIGRLSPGSRVRQVALWRAVRLGVEAYNRRDLDAVVIAYQPDLEYHPYREFVEAALTESCYAGVSTLKGGRVAHQRDFLDQAEALELVGLPGEGVTAPP